ncbi:hypothetical protein NGRA_1586, partial [Nosema granulosis]
FKQYKVFLDFITERTIFNIQKKEDLIFKKILIYIIFITVHEIRNLIRENEEIIDKYGDYCVTDVNGQLNFLKSILQGFYSYDFYIKEVVENPGYLISLKNFYKHLLRFKFEDRHRFQNIRNILLRVNKRIPFLDLLNQISISTVDGRLIIPLNFIEGIIKSFLDTFYPAY